MCPFFFIILIAEPDIKPAWSCILCTLAFEGEVGRGRKSLPSSGFMGCGVCGVDRVQGLCGLGLKGCRDFGFLSWE